VKTAADPRPAHLLTLSARDPAALEQLRQDWLDALTPTSDLAALARSAAGRARLPHRLAVVAADTASARTALSTAAASTAGRPRVAFLCTGQGSTYAGMAAGLMELSPVFRSVVERCDAVMELDRPLARIFTDAALLGRTDYAQPALYALSAGLGALWRSWGIEPVAVLGHSVGEYAAAHLAGVLTLEDGARLIATRGRLMQALPAGGGMAALLGEEAAARRVLARHPEVEVAGLNSPMAMTVAGPEAAIDRLLADPALKSGLAGQKLTVSHAFHSQLLEPMLEELAAAADRVAHGPATVPVVGNLDGAVVARHDGAYWRAHARQPVRFAAGLQTLAGLGCTHLVELGAQPILSGFARSAHPAMAAVPSLTRPRPNGPAGQAWITLMEAAARLWRDGAPLDPLAINAPFPAAPTDAPTYPFQRQRYWFRPDAAAKAPSTTSEGTLAGERIELATGDLLFRSRFDTARLPFLADHVVMGETIVPGASHIVAMLAASGAALRDIVFAAPMTLPTEGCDVQLLVHGDQVGLHARGTDEWIEHASAVIAAKPGAEQVDRATIAARCQEDPDGPAALHAMLGERGITLGPSFRGIQRLFRGDNEALVQVALPAGVPPVAPLHPAQLDACFQALGATFSGGGEGGAFLPLAVDQAVLHRPWSGPLWAHACVRTDAGASGDVATGDIMLFDDAGDVIAAITGLTIKHVVAGAQADPSERWTYAVDWEAEPVANLPAPTTIGVAALAAGVAAAPKEEPGFGEALEQLAAAYAAQARVAKAAPGQERLFAHLATMSKGAPGDDADALADCLIGRFGQRLEIDLARRSGRALPGVLAGKTDPLSVLFGDAEDSGKSVYADPPFARMLNAMVVAALKTTLGALPAGRALRVLEIGAGTGAVFEALGAAVPAGKLAYTFTDISPAFVEAAEEHFGAGLARSATLDIERAPETQGYASGAYDVVVAANVLHATRDLRASLRHAARLLAPHGVLLLLEAAQRSNWSDLVFGLTPGWWRFADTDLRVNHPLLSGDRWQALLRERFAAAEIVASPGGGAQVLAIAQAPKAERETLTWEAPANLEPLALANAAVAVVQQALAKPNPPALRLVTRGAQAVGQSKVNADHAVVLGIGRVAALEHPELDCRLIDLPPEAELAIAATAPSDASEIAWRDGAWLRPRLARAALAAETVFQTSGTHLVTGGLGGLGLPLAAWLRERGAERVVLMARRPKPGITLPAGIEVMLGDVANAVDVKRTVDACGADLRGVFHLAGTVQDGALLGLKSDGLDRVFAAKVTGARNLEAALGDRTLDAFVLFGSSAGLLGNPGQAAHAAANSWLGLLAAARRQRGLAGLCIDWGAWGEAGTMTRSSIGEQLVAAGAALMAPEHAFAALGRALVADRPRYLIAAITWSRFLAGFGEAIPAFFAAVAPAKQKPAARLVAGGDPRASVAALRGFVAAAAAAVLGAAPNETPDPDVPLNEAGLDSLMALELRKSLGSGLDLRLPATLLFNFPTINALTEHLAELIGLSETAEEAPEAASPPIPTAIPQEQIVESVMRMSEDEMAEAIAQEFALTVGTNG
jgi:acyl transferase domain-containing protein/acyl carrier protein